MTINSSHVIHDVILASVLEPQVLLISSMNTVITSERIDLPPGAVLKLLGNWQDYQRMLADVWKVQNYTKNPSPNLSPKRREALKPPFPCRKGRVVRFLKF